MCSHWLFQIQLAYFIAIIVLCLSKPKDKIMTREGVVLPSEDPEAFSVKFNQSQIRVVPPEAGLLAIDWHRHRAAPIFINGTSIKDFASQYNDFNTLDDVKKFLREKCLQGLNHDKPRQDQALEYLLQTFHQGGFMHPVDTTLASGITNRGFSIDKDSRQYEININSTPTGITIQESVSYGKVLINFPDDPLQRFCMVNVATSLGTIGHLISEEPGKPIVAASGKLAIDFPEDFTGPKFTSSENSLSFGHRALEERCLKGSLVKYPNQQKETIRAFLKEEREHTEAVRAESLQQQRDSRLQQLETALEKGESVRVFVVPDEKQFGILMPFLQASIIGAESPAEKLFFQEMHDQITRYPPGTQLPILESEEKYVEQLKSGLDNQNKLAVLPYMVKLKELGTIRSTSRTSADLNSSEKIILNTVADRTENDLKQHIKKIMTSSEPVKADELNAKIDSHISEAKKMPYTSGLRGWLNKLFTIFHKGEQAASISFKDQLTAMKGSPQATKPKQEENLQQPQTTLRPP